MKTPSSSSHNDATIGGGSLNQKPIHNSTGATRRRKRPRSTNSVSWHVFALATLALASTSQTDKGPVVLASDTRVISSTKDDIDSASLEANDEVQTNNKPYRSTYGGRIKLVPDRKFIRVVKTTASIDDGTTTPWKKNDESTHAIETGQNDVPKPLTTQTSFISFLNGLSPFVKRGILLAGLTAIAVIDRNPTPTSQALALSSGRTAYSSWLPNLRLDWNKFWGLPGEILPSLSAALMIAWIPNLILQKAYFELAFLFCSLTTQPTLRSYLLTEVFPALGGTVRKLFWSEFWKQAWDYLLEPFPHNVLLPPKPKATSLPQSDTENEVWNKWQTDVSKFWSDRVVSRIDKWTTSSVKALLQKNVQASVNGLAEDSFKAVAYGWYPEISDQKRPVISLPSNEDTARMIELECEDGDKECNDESITLEQDLSNDGHDDNKDQDREENGDKDASATVEVQEILTLGDDPPIEDAMLSD